MAVVLEDRMDEDNASPEKDKQLNDDTESVTVNLLGEAYDIEPVSESEALKKHHPGHYAPSNPYVEFTPFEKDSELYACLRNEFVEYKQTTTLREAKLLRIIISQIKSNTTDFFTYRIKVKDLADMLEIGPKSIYRDIKQICQNLHHRIVTIERPDGTWTNLSWVERSEYDGKYITICLSNALKPFLINLDKNYVQYQIKDISGFTSIYGLRLYEILKARFNKFKNKKTSFSFSLDELRYKLNCDDKHTDFMHFNSRVLQMAADDINNNQFAKFMVSYDKETEGRKVVGIIFHIIPKND